MNTNDLLARWSTLSLEQIEEQLQSGEDVPEVEQMLGLEQAVQVRELALEPEARGMRQAVVLLPGVMGSLLASVRGVTSMLWLNPLIFVNGQCQYLQLNQDGSADASVEIDCTAFSLEKLSYLKIGLALRKKTDLFEFPYDWRRPIEYNADVLHQSIERWSDGNPGQQFTLVGHSMGGLVSRAYLARHPDSAERRVRRLIMHGTPHFGAAAAVENLFNGNQMMSVIDRLNDRNDMRRVVLSMPSLYELLPAPPDLFPSGRAYPANWDLYDASAWQLDGLRQDYLEAARRFYRLLADSDPQVPQVEIAGCHVNTMVGVERVHDNLEKPHLNLAYQDEGPDSGDGTVPLWSALLPKAEIYYFQGVHRSLPDKREVIDATLDLIEGGRCDLPAELPRPKTGLFRRELEAPPEVEAQQLRQKIETGSAGREDLEKLYFAF